VRQSPTADPVPLETPYSGEIAIENVPPGGAQAERRLSSVRSGTAR